MSIAQTPSQRQLMHRRAIDVQVFSRDDGLFDLEARLSDVKTHAVELGGALRHAGEPVHEMVLHLTIDRAFNILHASSQTHWMPYPGACNEHGDAYAQLAGLNLMQGFRRGVNDRLSGIKGCTHLTELCHVLPTAAIQAFAGLVVDTSAAQPDGRAPHQLDRCHALRTDAAVVQRHYPRWFRAAKSDGVISPSPQSAAAGTRTG